MWFILRGRSCSMGGVNTLRTEKGICSPVSNIPVYIRWTANCIPDDLGGVYMWKYGMLNIKFWCLHEICIIHMAPLWTTREKNVRNKVFVSFLPLNLFITSPAKSGMDDREFCKEKEKGKAECDTLLNTCTLHWYRGTILPSVEYVLYCSFSCDQFSSAL